VTHDVGDIAAAQADIQAAEDDPWRLREETLGWARPASATRAELVADSFSDEDGSAPPHNAGAREVVRLRSTRCPDRQLEVGFERLSGDVLGWTPEQVVGQPHISRMHP
jgi:hypothetical protein